MSAADVMPPDRARRFQRYGALERVLGRPVGTAVFADVYGMVELAGPAALRLYPPAPRGRELPAIGFVLPGFSARVVGPGRRALRLGAAGELQLRGPGLFGGYVGVPEPRLGELPVALVVPRAEFDAQAFLAWAAERVAPYRRPREALTVEALPRGRNGKVDRKAATELARAALARQRSG